jgi:AraC-like DNA-binding protein
VNGLLTELNTYRTLFDDQLDAAERIRSAAQLFPNVSQNTIAQLLNVSKSYVSTVFGENGFHRTPNEQE